MKSPFVYQAPLAPPNVSGRSDLLAELGDRVTSNRVTALIGPRRFGKTSVMKRLAQDLSADGYEVIWVDLYGVASLGDMAVRFDRGLNEITTSWRSTLSRFAASKELTIGGVAVGLRSSHKPDPATTFETVLDILTNAAEKHKVVLMIDEFSGIANVERAAAILRTSLQHHYDNIGLLFAGSEPSVMKTLFSDRAAPFYGQADLVKIQPLTQQAILEIVESGFAATNRNAGAGAEQIWRFAQGHPQRSMQLADALWRRVPEGETATNETWGQTLEAVRSAESMSFERMYGSLSAAQQKLLRLVAHGDSIYGRSAEVMNLANSSASDAIRTLTDTGHLEKTESTHRLVDPTFADWLKHRFPK